MLKLNVKFEIKEQHNSTPNDITNIKTLHEILCHKKCYIYGNVVLHIYICDMVEQHSTFEHSNTNVNVKLTT